MLLLNAVAHTLQLAGAPALLHVTCRAIEAVGLAPEGMGGAYIQQQYGRLLRPLEQQQQQQQSSSAAVWPVNTHGGLLGFGAPWEVPAMHSLIEAVAQLRGEAAGRQVAAAKRALVYGNGGVLSASAVAILESCKEERQAAASKL
jgi:acetyl-CoA acetyltransferase